MKRIILLGAVALCGMMNAQQAKFGLKGGYALSKLNSDELSQSFDDIQVENKSKSGYFVGAFAEYGFNEKFAVQGEIQYANLGGNLELTASESGLNLTVQDKINFNQILIPISAKYYATPALALYAGPSTGFNSGYKTKIKIEETNVPSEFLGDLDFAELENEQDDQLKENLKSTSFNLFFGGEYTFYNGLFFDARYTVGLTNYEKNPVGGSETKMNYLQLGLGYKF